MRAAVVKDSDGFVTNVIAVANLNFPVDAGHTLIKSDDANPGDTWDGAIFIPPVAAPIEPTKDETLVADLQTATTIAALKAAFIKRFS